jgi:hypothetical protein
MGVQQTYIWNGQDQTSVKDPDGNDGLCGVTNQPNMIFGKAGDDIATVVIDLLSRKNQVVAQGTGDIAIFALAKRAA